MNSIQEHLSKSRKQIRMEKRVARGFSRSGCSRSSEKFLFAPLLLFVVSTLCLAAASADSSSITFSLDFPSSDPEHYSFTVDSDGHAKYESVARISSDSENRETYHADFQFSPGARARIFDLAAQAHYFSGKIDSGNRKIAFTGTKKLTYHDAGRNNTAEFNYSTVAPVQQLTTLFQSVAATMEFGRRLAYYHRYQKLALDEDLKRMEAQAQDNQLAEILAVEPILREIVEDTSVINVDRAHAQRLIDLGKKEDLAAH
jgi:hypothetical protein